MNKLRILFTIILGILLQSPVFGSGLSIPTTLDDVWSPPGDLIDQIEDACEDDAIFMKFESNGKYYPDDCVCDYLDDVGDAVFISQWTSGALWAILDELCPCGVESDYSYSAGSFCNVNFTDKSFTTKYTTQIISYHWDFGDGNSSQAQNPSHYYGSTGSYNVCLTVFAIDPFGGCCEKTYCQTIRVSCEESSCKINPEYSTSVSSKTVTFRNTSTSNREIVGYLWEFGDGTTSKEMNPVHTFPDFAAYDICLHVIAKDGSSCCYENSCNELVVGSDRRYKTKDDRDFDEMEKTDLNKWKVGPNPANSLLKFEALPEGNLTIQIGDISGRVIDSYDLSVTSETAESISLPISMSSGIYLVTVHTAEEKTTQKIEVMR